MAAKKKLAAKVVELGDRWMSGRRKIKAAARKAGMPFEDLLGIVDEIGMPGKRTKDQWVKDARDLVKETGGNPRAIDWATLIAVLIPIIQELLANCGKPKPVPPPTP